MRFDAPPKPTSPVSTVAQASESPNHGVLTGAPRATAMAATRVATNVRPINHHSTETTVSMGARGSRLGVASMATPYRHSILSTSDTYLPQPGLKGLETRGPRGGILRCAMPSGASRDAYGGSINVTGF